MNVYGTKPLESGIRFGSAHEYANGSHHCEFINYTWDY